MMKALLPGITGNDESGFTLLETIIALAIMVVTFASIISVESNSINASIRARQMNVVAMLARNKMIDLEYEVEGKTFDEIKKEGGESFKAPFQDYRWTSVIKEIKFPNLLGSGAGGKEGESGGGGAVGEPQTDMMAMMGRLITNFLSKSIREMTVTIHWKKGAADQSFSVSTYWVNLNNDFELSE